jgi:hypothetical protein
LNSKHFSAFVNALFQQCANRDTGNTHGNHHRAQRALSGQGTERRLQSHSKDIHQTR